jgi:Protein of unknown function (DUF3386)
MNENRGLSSRWQLDLLALGFVALAGMLTSLARGGDNEQGSPTAASLMQTAHDGRAIWREFPGFTAHVKVSLEGATAEGALKVSPAGTVKLDLPQDERFAWAAGTLKSVVGHRLSDDGAILDVTFADDQVAHPLGRLLKSSSASDKSLWRVHGDLLTEVHRVNEKTRFIISVADVWRTTEGKHLPRDYTVTTWDNATQRIVSTRQLHNEWTRVGHLDLPKRLLAATSREDGSRRVEQIELSEHKLSSTATTGVAAP